MDATSIQYINGTNDISMNDDENFIHKYYAPFLQSKNNEDLSSRSEYDSSKLRVRRNKNIFIYYKKNQRVLNGKYHCYFFINDTKISSHMDQISEHINSSNQKFIPMIRWAQ